MADAAQRRLRAMVALALIAGIGSAQAARTPDLTNMPEAGGGAVFAPSPYGVAPKSAQSSEAQRPTPAADSVAPAAQLPHRASAITETYGDWVVKCVVDNAAKLCTLSQTQTTKETGQLIVAIELLARDGKADGNMLMPFGLRLDAGAILKLDGEDLAQARFSTCMAQGCLLPVSFPTTVTDVMGRAKTLTVAAQSLNTGQTVVFNVSLNGFAAALDRTIQLGS